jgi:hypothetical protein
MTAEPKKFNIPNQVLIKTGEPDGFGSIFSPTCKYSLPKNPVPVTIGFDSNRVVGFCDLYMEGNNLMGNISLLSPEVTEGMTKIADYQISGESMSGEGLKVTSFSVKAVAMGIKNSDVGFRRLP